MRHMKISLLEENGFPPPVRIGLAQMYPEFNTSLTLKRARAKAQNTMLQREAFRSPCFLYSHQVELGGNELRPQVVQFPSKAILRVVHGEDIGRGNAESKIKNAGSASGRWFSCWCCRGRQRRWLYIKALSGEAWGAVIDVKQHPEEW